MVLVRNDGVRGKCKLADIWEEVPHIIISQPNTDIPVFDVKPENQKGRTRRLHRNKLLPFICLPCERKVPSSVELSTESSVSVSDTGSSVMDDSSTQHTPVSSDNSPRYVIPARRPRRNRRQPDRYQP